jgi:hypothetical protein|tara:strand:- start:83 stop:406 length:324 start_codon:yes stop_codon:yes gene_type:complete
MEDKEMRKTLYLGLLYLAVYSMSVVSEENDLFSIDKWEGAGGDTMFYYVHFTIEKSRVEVSCRLFDKNNDLIDGESWKFYSSGWEKRTMGTGQRTNAKSIKCRAKTF